MLQAIAVVQIFLFLSFVLLERIAPARQLPRANRFHLWWVFVNSFAFIWLCFAFYAWAHLPDGRFDLATGYTLVDALIFYLVYSFCNYWWHRYKHRNPVLWRVIHSFHHCPTKMETAVAFFKHPFEIIINTALITGLAWFFCVPPEVVILTLAIEGALETYHHSNIRTPRSLRRLGYLIQTPEMHLVHHQRGLHRYNYAAFLWDGVFGTARLPREWQGEQGFSDEHGIVRFFLPRL